MPFAVIVGAGTGTGASTAKAFARLYPVALLARKEQSYSAVVDEINKSGGKAIGIPTDVSDSASVTAAFQQITNQWGTSCAAAVFNASGPFQRKPFLELVESDLMNSINVSLKGGFLFSQAALPLLLNGVEGAKHPPTLIFTGATASVKSNAMNVAHAVIDGGIDTPWGKERHKDAQADAVISPDAIADSYVYLHQQPRSCFTNEIDIRPFCEKW